MASSPRPRPSSWGNNNYQLTVSGEGGDAGGSGGTASRSATKEAAAAPDARALSTVPPPAHQSPHTTTKGPSEQITKGVSTTFPPAAGGAVGVKTAS